MCVFVCVVYVPDVDDGLIYVCIGMCGVRTGGLLRHSVCVSICALVVCMCVVREGMK